MYLKTEIKKLIGKTLSTDLLEKVTEYSIWQHYSPLLNVPTKEGGRERLWEDAITTIGDPDILFIEFGVWRGDSIRCFADLITGTRARFYGFDSFEGLPEYWRGMPAGHFSTSGNAPEIDDHRVKFIKGWFQKSVPESLDEIAREAAGRTVLVHFDADIYSATLFLLFTLSYRVKEFHFIFDEFSGHELRALHNFVQSSGAKVKYLSQTTWQDCPAAVFGHLSLVTD